jgi:hypothetical protein
MHTPGNNLIDAVAPLECDLFMSSHLCHSLYGWPAGVSTRSRDPPIRPAKAPCRRIALADQRKADSPAREVFFNSRVAVKQNPEHGLNM